MFFFPRLNKVVMKKVFFKHLCVVLFHIYFRFVGSQVCSKCWVNLAWFSYMLPFHKNKHNTIKISFAELTITAQKLVEIHTLLQCFPKNYFLYTYNQISSFISQKNLVSTILSLAPRYSIIKGLVFVITLVSITMLYQCSFEFKYI